MIQQMTCHSSDRPYYLSKIFLCEVRRSEQMHLNEIANNGDIQQQARGHSSGRKIQQLGSPALGRGGTYVKIEGFRCASRLLQLKDPPTLMPPSSLPLARCTSSPSLSKAHKQIDRQTDHNLKIKTIETNGIR